MDIKYNLGEPNGGRKPKSEKPLKGVKAGLVAVSLKYECTITEKKAV